MDEVLLTIWIVLFCISELNALYYAFFFIAGLLLKVKKYPMAEDKQRFCLFVPCHNEEAVVAATIKNFCGITYDEKLFDVYFVADNCTDLTVERLNEAIEESGKTNFRVLVRNVPDPDKQGKPHALRWGIELLENSAGFYDKYDFFMIVDADNFVDADVLKHINSQYLSYKENKRPDMIQVYHDSKNARGLIARGYFQAFRVFNPFWQKSKDRLGLTPGIYGTGYVISTRFLKELGGFDCNSLTEDQEIQVKAVITGKRVAYNAHTRIYAEHPTKLNQAVRQRIRWAQGHWYLFFKYYFRLFLQIFNFKTWRATLRKMDMMAVLFTKVAMLCSGLLSVLSGYYLIFDRGANALPPVVNYINFALGALSVIMVPVSAFYGGTSEEKRRVVIDFIPNVLAIGVYGVIDAVTTLIGLFKCGNQKVWSKTSHGVTVMTVTKQQKLEAKNKEKQNRKERKEKIKQKTIAVEGE